MGEQMEFYLSIEGKIESVIYKVKGSKFISYAYPVASREEIDEALENLQKAHSKANHCCYAWKLGGENVQYRYNDDGEPANTAGKPIYGQLLSFGLTNVLVVVVRYFGGTKLGVGGLIQSYREAARLALEQAEVCRHEIVEVYELRFDYKDLSRVMRMVRELGLRIGDQDMAMVVAMKLEVPKKKKDKFSSHMEQLREVRCIPVS